jgi:Zn-dependent peptidase ImmA (M78 family)
LTSTATKSVYERLRKVGFTRPYINKIAALPTWWDDALWEDPASYALGAMSLSRHLGIDISTLQNADASLRLKNFGICKFKKQAGTQESELELARVIATRAANLAVVAMDRSYQPIKSAAAVRSLILESANWVGFEELLDYCWDSGVPVLHICNFPTAAKKPMGFTLRVQGRPAIVLCNKNEQPAWQLFILAHELGHIFHDHIPADGALMDETVNQNEPDSEETQADEYAIEVLTGKPKHAFNLSGRWLKADKFAAVALDFGKRNQVDPGHVVLNCAHTMGGEFWKVANAALKLINSHANAVEVVGERLAENLDWESLPEDSSEFLMRITGQESPE